MMNGESPKNGNKQAQSEQCEQVETEKKCGERGPKMAMSTRAQCEQVKNKKCRGRGPKWQQALQGSMQTSAKYEMQRERPQNGNQQARAQCEQLQNAFDGENDPKMAISTLGLNVNKCQI